ncbi:zinc ribbon protein [Bacillus oleivorans]|uniref:Zinc ribbon protein n=1 Tax=Bacillus oleivorans TaxID=1448271 RepID=A0A285CJX0_9BACI|nr:zinc-ribbon domain-containing protein [Bacillus oleivorans]SNX67303.1 zinc ribbon protein [Bacillus oleivorans]
MSFCPNCGHGLNSDQQFCPECGKPLSRSTSTSASNSGVTVTVEETTAPPKPMSKRQKIVLLSSGVAVVLLVVAYFVLQHIASVEYRLDRFEQALEEKDEKALMKYVSSYDANVAVKESNIQDFIEYVNDDPFYKEDLLESLREQAKNLDDPQVELYEEATVLLKKSGKQFLLFDNYKIQLLPYYFEIETNYAGAKIFIDGKEVGESDSDYFVDTYGPYLPGEYTIKVEYQSELASLDHEENINLFDQSGQNIYVDMWLEGYYVEVFSNHGDGGLYIDGNYAGTVWELGTIGPIDLDGSHTIYMEKEFPWGTVKSEEFEITDTYYDLSIDPMTEDMRNQVAEAIYTFEVQRFLSLQTLDPAHIVATPFYAEDLAAEVQYYIDSEYVYYGTGLDTVTVDLDTMELYTEEDYIHVDAYGKIDWTGDVYPASYAEEETPEFVESITTETDSDFRSYGVLYNFETGQWEVDGLYWSPYSEFEPDGGLVVFDANTEI